MAAHYTDTRTMNPASSLTHTAAAAGPAGLWLVVALLLHGCGGELEARSVTQFLDDQIALEATLTRCNADRSRSRDDLECQNAREAAKRISTVEEAERRRAFEAESQRKVEELRRRNEALEERVRRMEEEARRHEEQRYLEQFMEPEPGVAGATGDSREGMAGSEAEPRPADDASAAGTVTAEPPAELPGAGPDAPAGLQDVRDELRRRSETGADAQTPQ